MSAKMSEAIKASLLGVGALAVLAMIREVFSSKAAILAPRPEVPRLSLKSRTATLPKASSKVDPPADRTRRVANPFVEELLESSLHGPQLSPDCLYASDLDYFAEQGTFPEKVERHISSCASCRMLMTMVINQKSYEDSFIEYLRQFEPNERQVAR